MSLGEHHNRVSNDADHDRRNAIQYVGGESNDIAETVAAKLGDVNASPHSDRHAENARESKNKSGADDSVRHSAARFANRFRSLGEERPVDRAHSPVDKVGEYCA